MKLLLLLLTIFYSLLSYCQSCRKINRQFFNEDGAGFDSIYQSAKVNYNLNKNDTNALLQLIKYGCLFSTAENFRDDIHSYFNLKKNTDYNLRDWFPLRYLPMCKFFDCKRKLDSVLIMTNIESKEFETLLLLSIGVDYYVFDYKSCTEKSENYFNYLEKNNRILDWGFYFIYANALVGSKQAQKAIPVLQGYYKKSSNPEALIELLRILYLNNSFSQILALENEVIKRHNLQQGYLYVFASKLRLNNHLDALNFFLDTIFSKIDTSYNINGEFKNFIGDSIVSIYVIESHFLELFADVLKDTMSMLSIKFYEKSLIVSQYSLEKSKSFYKSYVKHIYSKRKKRREYLKQVKENIEKEKNNIKRIKKKMSKYSRTIFT